MNRFHIYKTKLHVSTGLKIVDIVLQFGYKKKSLFELVLQAL